MQLNESNYFSSEAEAYYMGSTQFKNFQKCEAQALVRIRGEYIEGPSAALLVGSYVDEYFSGTLPLFKARHPEICTKQGTLKSEYQQAEYIIRRIESDKQFMAAVSGGSQVIMTGEIEGVPVKIKVDSLLPDRIVDMKIMRDTAESYDKEKPRMASVLESVGLRHSRGYLSRDCPAEHRRAASVWAGRGHQGKTGAGH